MLREFNYLPNFDVFVGPVCFQNMLSGDAHRAKTMKNGLVEASDSSELRKDLKETVCIIICRAFKQAFIHGGGYNLH